MNKIDEIRKRRESFPWETEMYDDPDEPFWGEMSVRGDADMNMGICIGYGEDQRRFVTFMAAAPEDISFLLAEVSRLESERDEAEADRALGARVRAALPFLPGNEEINARHMESGALTLDGYEDTEGPCDVLRAIANALREEGGAMTDRCEKCGREKGDGLNADHHTDGRDRCWRSEWLSCKLAAAYRRGLREGVELAKRESCITEDTHYVSGMGHVHEIDWTDVDAELERRLK